MTQSADSFFFYLPHSFARQVKLQRDFLECKRMVDSNAEEKPEHFPFSFRKRIERAIDFLLERFVHHQGISYRGIRIYKHVKQVVCFAQNKRCIKGNLLATHPGVV